MHRMTGRERVLAVLSGQQPDHRPFMPITMMFAADVLGVKYLQCIRDHKTMADAQIKTAEMFGLDHVSAIAPTSEAVDLGARFQWFDDQPPGIIEQEALLTDKADLARLPSPGSVLGASMEERVRGVEWLRQRVGSELIVEGWVEGPCSDAADLRGMNRLMVDFSDDPAFVEQLFNYSVELAVGFAAAQIRRCRHHRHRRSACLAGRPADVQKSGLAMAEETGRRDPRQRRKSPPSYMWKHP